MAYKHLSDGQPEHAKSKALGKRIRMRKKAKHAKKRLHERIAGSDTLASPRSLSLLDALRLIHHDAAARGGVYATRLIVTAAQRERWASGLKAEATTLIGVPITVVLDGPPLELRHD